MNKSANRLQFQMTTIINYQKKLTREKVTVPKVGKKKNNKKTTFRTVKSKLVASPEETCD